METKDFYKKIGCNHSEDWMQRHEAIMKQKKCSHNEVYPLLVAHLERVCRYILNKKISEKYLFLHRSVNKDSVIEEILTEAFELFFKNYDATNKKNNGAKEASYMRPLLLNKLYDYCKLEKNKNRITLSTSSLQDNTEEDEELFCSLFDRVIHADIDGNPDQLIKYEQQKKDSRKKTNYITVSGKKMADLGLSFMRVPHTKQCRSSLPFQLVHEDMESQYYLRYIKNHSKEDDSESLDALCQIIRYHFISGKVKDKHALADVTERPFHDPVTAVNLAKLRWQALSQYEE